MAIFRCKICGKGIAVQKGVFSCLCDYCGEQQTFPAVHNEKLTGLFNQANELRMKCEFNSAAEIYETIIQQNPKEAEAYWGLLLCKYGTEYIEDPKNHGCVPLCHRVSYFSFSSDKDYLKAIQYASTEQKKFYQKEALRVDDIQRNIIALAQKEPPCDVFICYKKNDGGVRTPDSAIADCIAKQLTAEKLKVFYDAITPEDESGTDYEAVVFSALNSAKVMLVLGTAPEYFNAVWVKNEWSCFLNLAQKDHTRRLIPCFRYRDITPNELPKELSRLKAQDIGNAAFFSDLLLSIRTVIPQKTPAAVPSAAAPANPTLSSSQNYNALLTQGFLALKEKRWKDADAVFNQVLNQDSECGEAYWGKFLASQNHPDGTVLSKSLALAACDKGSAKSETLEAFPANSAHIETMAGQYEVPGFYDASEIRSAYDFSRTYSSLVNGFRSRKQTMLQCVDSARMFVLAKKYAKGTLQKDINQFRYDLEKNIDEAIAREQQSDSAKVKKLRQDYQDFLKKTDDDVIQRSNQETANREDQYQQGLQKIKEKRFSDAISVFETLKPYKDTEQLIVQCENSNTEAARKKIWIIILILIAIAFLPTIFKNDYNYKHALTLMEEGNYEEACIMFTELGTYKDSPEKNKECLSSLVLQKKNAVMALAKEVDDTEVTSTPIALNNCKGNPAKNSDCWKKLLSNVQPGNHVCFGHYEQDNNKDNGTEIIEWRVLAREENRLLLISEYGLDAKPYNESATNTNWAKSTLRNWLNEKFYKNAFSAEEQELIALTNLGNNIQDKVFLLSVNDAVTYFASNKDRQCKLSKYVDANDNFNNAGLWWLRSIDSNTHDAARIYADGSICNYGAKVNTYNAIRPALWLDLDADKKSIMEPTEVIVQTPVESGQAEVAANPAQGGDFWYREANPHSEQMGWLYNGTKVFAPGEKKTYMDEEWVKIETENKLIGWIRLSSLAFSTAGTNAP